MFSFFSGTNNIDHNFLQPIASTIISAVWCFKRRVTNLKLLCDNLWSINTQKDEKLKTRNKSNWLNSDDSLSMELFYDGYLHLIRKGD